MRSILFERLQFLALFLTGGLNLPNILALSNLPHFTVRRLTGNHLLNPVQLNSTLQKFDAEADLNLEIFPPYILCTSTVII